MTPLFVCGLGISNGPENVTFVFLLDGCAASPFVMARHTRSVQAMRAILISPTPSCSHLVIPKTEEWGRALLRPLAAFLVARLEGHYLAVRRQMARGNRGSWQEADH